MWTSQRLCSQKKTSRMSTIGFSIDDYAEDGGKEFIPKGLILKLIAHTEYRTFANNRYPRSCKVIQLALVSVGRRR